MFSPGAHRYYHTYCNLISVEVSRRRVLSLRNTICHKKGISCMRSPWLSEHSFCEMLLWMCESLSHWEWLKLCVWFLCLFLWNTLLSSLQYRVESMMLRVAKPLNYIPVTPSVQQRAHQRAPQCVPLIMEPESRFYSNSVVVLDFQSLYPSIIIAYNYCFSTCLGHVDSLGT